MKQWIAMGVMTIVAPVLAGAAVLAGSAVALADDGHTQDKTTTSERRETSASTSSRRSTPESATPDNERSQSDTEATQDRPGHEARGDLDDNELDDSDRGDPADTGAGDPSDHGTEQSDSGGTDGEITDTGTPAPSEVVKTPDAPGEDRADTANEPAPQKDRPYEQNPTEHRFSADTPAPALSEKRTAPTSSSDIDTVPSTAAAEQAAELSAPVTVGSTPSLKQPKAAAAGAAVSQKSTGASTTIPAAVSAPTPPKPTLLHRLGSIVLDAVMRLIHLIDGPPALPANSTVTVRTSRLVIPIGNGRTVQADWYFPQDYDESTRLVYFQHGIGASGPMYSYTLARIAQETQSIIVAPSLSSNFLDPSAVWTAGDPMIKAIADLFAGDRAELTESAGAAAGHPVTLPERFVMMGHSLGGYTTISSTRYLIDNGAIDDLVGIVSLDGVDVNGTLPAALEQLTGHNYRPVYHLSSESYTWNLHGSLAHDLEAVRPGQFNGLMLEGGRHIDALQGGNPLIQFAEYVIAGFSAPRNVAAVPVIAAGWVNDLFAGTTEGIYGAPGERTEIPTGKGTAAVVALPLPVMAPVYGTAFDAISEFILGLLVRVAVYQPLAGAASDTPAAAGGEYCSVLGGSTCHRTALPSADEARSRPIVAATAPKIA